MANDTILFKDAVGEYSDFISSPQAQDVSQFCKVFEHDGLLSTVVNFDTWSAEVYRLLLRRYRNWEIAYFNVDDFLDTLWERIEIHTPNFYIRRSFYNKMLNLSDSDLLSQGYNIQNFIEHTDDVVDDPLNTLLSTITNQSSSKAFSDYLSRLRQAISSHQYSLIDDYCRKFRSLFLMIQGYVNYCG